MTTTEAGVTQGQDLRDLYAASYARLVGQVGAVCGDRHEAEEAVQDAFVRLIGSWSKVSRYDDPEAWVRKVSLRQVSNRRRKTVNGLRAAHRHGPPADVPEPTPASVDAERALAALPERQRAVIVLHRLGLDTAWTQVRSPNHSASPSGRSSHGSRGPEPRSSRYSERTPTMSDPLDHAVDAQIAAYRPDTVPSFAVIEARKRTRDRRRLAAGGSALSVLAVAGAVVLVPSLTASNDRLTGSVAAPDGAVTDTAPRSPAPVASSTAMTFTSCVGLNIGKNSQFDGSYDPASGVLTVDYYIDYPNGGEGHAVIDGADPSCLANPTVRPLLEDARAGAEASMRSSCASAREFLAHGPGSDPKSQSVRPEDAERAVAICDSE